MREVPKDTFCPKSLLCSPFYHFSKTQITFYTFSSKSKNQGAYLSYATRVFNHADRFHEIMKTEKANDHSQAIMTQYFETVNTDFQSLSGNRGKCSTTAACEN